ncbi:MAG TPA: thiamine phosphate synthase, partial [Pyrinomonadaceae bacterium]|nr:thiamine phosphate synthase [Pyrinomonadaceae bacterium]
LFALVGSAVEAGVALVQLREKLLRPRVLYELTARCARLTRGTGTRLVVNDRADIARAAGADGVQLTSQSLDSSVVRRAFGRDFLVGVSAHSPEDARRAMRGGADFALLGPVFDTPSKRAYGPPLGLPAFAAAARALAPFPLLAIGGITLDNSADVLRAGAHGVAAIRLFGDASGLSEIVRALEASADAEAKRSA